MTPEFQRIAIAEACKWGASGLHETDHSYEHGMFATPDGVWVGDPLKDLNAMHEVEKVMTDEQCERYEAFLNDPANIPDGNTPAADYVFHSTAAQRAEAFLRTLGLWK